MAQYILRHGALAAAVDVLNAVALNQGGVATPITVPTGVSKIVQIGIDLGKSVVGIANSGCTVELVLSGTGVKFEQHLPAGGITENTTSVGGTKLTPPVFYDVDIDVVGGNIIDAACYLHGVDPGTPQIDLCLVMV